MRLISKWKATGKLPKDKELRRVLIAICSYYDQHADRCSEIPIERDLVELLAERIFGPGEWLRPSNHGRRRQAELDHAQWQAMAKNIWAGKPGLSHSAVGRIIADKLGGKSGTIRKAIKKK
jgi:hypothetical protein